jgi:hypothetical protein
MQHAQRLTRRLRHHFGDQVRIMVGLGTAEPSPGPREERLEATGADLLATSLRHAVRQIEEHVQPDRPEATPTAA